MVREGLRMLTEPNWVGKLRRPELRIHIWLNRLLGKSSDTKSDGRFDSRIYRYDKGKRCGNSYIPSSFNCTRGKAPVKKSITSRSTSNKKEESEGSNNLGSKIAIGAAIAGVGAISIAALHDAYRITHDFDMPKTKSIRTAAKPFMKGKEGPIRERLQGALEEFYDKKVKEENWKFGDLVYENQLGGDLDPGGHFGVYLGKGEGRTAHDFLRFVADAETKSPLFGKFEIISSGRNLDKDDNLADVLFERVPSKNQPKFKFSESKIEERMEKLLEEKLEFDEVDANCESWSKLVVSGQSRSMQTGKLTLVGKTAIRTYTRVANFMDTGSLRVRDKDVVPIRKAARWLDGNNPGGNDRGYSAMIKVFDRLRRRDDKDEFFGLISPSEVIKPRMSDIEAISGAKRWLSVLVTALAMANGAN